MQQSELIRQQLVRYKQSWPPKVEARIMKKLIEELDEYTSDKALKGAASQFKNYCTIRRDLRQACNICDYSISLQRDIKRDNSLLDNVKDQIFLVRASIMHALILYSRWFKATNGKPMLQAGNYFVDNSVEMKAHLKVVELRDSYLAHNEKDILGGDRILVEVDDSGKFITSCSDWIEQMWPQDEELDLQMFRKLIGIVHDKIDAEIIPKKQQNLDARLVDILGKSA